MNGYAFELRHVLLFGVVALALGAALLSSSTGRAASSASCYTTGPKYKHAGSSSTTRYSVGTIGVSCSFAKAWVRRMVVQRPVKKTLSTGQVTGGVRGPKGWNCNAYDPAGGTKIPKLAYAGGCVPSAPPFNKKFAWQPA